MRTLLFAYVAMSIVLSIISAGQLTRNMEHLKKYMRSLYDNCAPLSQQNDVHVDVWSSVLVRGLNLLVTLFSAIMMLWLVLRSI